MAACADLAETLLRACPDLRILVTSRQPLRITGEATLTVQPLSVPEPDPACTPADLPRYESASLLVERATAVLPGFEVTEANAPRSPRSARRWRACRWRSSWRWPGCGC